jgi:PadR family transcriptional regulator PadR
MPPRRPQPTVVQGSLDMRIVKTLALEPMHGYGIGVRLEQISRGVFTVNAGPLVPAFRRLARHGLLRASWSETDHHRRARFSALTTAGRAALEEHTAARETQAAAIARILEARPEEI